METMFINMKNSKKESATQICFQFVTKIRVKKFRQTCCSSKLIYLLHEEEYKKKYKNNKLKKIAPTWNDDFELPDDSYSIADIQDYIDYIFKKYETLTTHSKVLDNFRHLKDPYKRWKMLFVSS